MQPNIVKHLFIELYGFHLSLCQTTKNGHDWRSFTVFSTCANFLSEAIYSMPSLLIALNVFCGVADEQNLSMEAG